MGAKEHLKPLKFGLVGKSLGHSFSKPYFESHFQNKYGKRAIFSNIELSDKQSLKLFCEADALTFNGFNVTIPYKEAIIPFLQILDESASNIKAVNVVKIVKHQLIGYNTDWVGFIESLAPYLKKETHKALILGTGGASKAIAYGLKTRHIPYTFVSTSDINQLSYEALDTFVMNTHDIIINTTPLGMYPNVDQSPKLPYKLITNQHIVMDLIYNPVQTQFLERCAKQGATVLNGQQMLEIQAQKAWSLWLS